MGRKTKGGVNPGGDHGGGEGGDYLLAVSELCYQAAFADPIDAIALAEEAVRLADAHQDEMAGYEARQALVQAGTFGGAKHKALVAFAWCLAYRDRMETDWVDFDLLWQYKWVVSGLVDVAAISRRQIEDALEDMQRRYDRAGYGLKAVLSERCSIALAMGDLDASKRFHKAMLAAKPDGMEDCKACQINSRVSMLLDLGQPAAAIKAAKPLIEGRWSCTVVPHGTFPYLLVPLALKGEWDLADRLLNRHYRENLRNPKFIRSMGDYLCYQALAGELPKAVRLAETRLPWAVAAVDDEARLRFFLGCRLLMLRLLDEGRKRMKFALPPAFAAAHLPDAPPSVPIENLAAAFLAAAQDVARQFDQRNGNSYVSSLVANNDELATRFKPLA